MNYEQYVVRRADLHNTAYKITHDKALTVAFMGGSVSDGMGSNFPEGSLRGGYRSRFMAHLRQTFDTVEFTEIRDTLGGNGSQYGVYIAEQFVASQKPDLVFIEYAVNNMYDGVTSEQLLWNHYETIIHKIRRANPCADIVLLYVSDRIDRSAAIIPILEQIAEKYQLISVHFYKAIADSLQENGYEWDEYYLNAKGSVDGVHPNANGYDVMTEALKCMVSAIDTEKTYTYDALLTPTPKAPLQEQANAFLNSTLGMLPVGWEKAQRFSYAGEKYNGCIQTKTDNPITVTFKGDYFGVLVEFGPECGVLEYVIDGGEVQTLDCNLGYSNPKARILLQNAENTEHVITLKLQAVEERRMAIAAFLLNGTVLGIK